MHLENIILSQRRQKQKYRKYVAVSVIVTVVKGEGDRKTIKDLK